VKDDFWSFVLTPIIAPRTEYPDEGPSARHVEDMLRMKVAPAEEAALAEEPAR
jgi:hypothetical protein